MSKATLYSVLVPVSFAQHSNVPPARLAQIAKRTGIKYDGGGMALIDNSAGRYDHFFYTSKVDVAKKFTAAARRAGFKASIEKDEEN